MRRCTTTSTNKVGLGQEATRQRLRHIRLCIGFWPIDKHEVMGMNCNPCIFTVRYEIEKKFENQTRSGIGQGCSVLFIYYIMAVDASGLSLMIIANGNYEQPWD